jgi:two-component system OmpR family sensor kinase
MPLRTLSIRARLAVWYGAVFAVSLGVVAVGFYGIVARRSLLNVDASLHEAVSAVSTALELELEGRKAFNPVAQRVVHEFRFRDLQVVLYDPATKTVAPGEAPEEDTGDQQVQPPVDSIARGIAAQAFKLDVPDFGPWVARASVTAPTWANLTSDDGEEVRAFAMPRRFGNRTVVIGALHRLKAHHRLLAELQLAFGIGIPLLLLLSTLGGYWLARKSLSPVAAMTARARQISASTLHDRLPVMNTGDELGHLAGVFNELLARLDAAFEQQRQFIADASHELRTPVAIVRGEAELALSRDVRTPEELRASLHTIEEEMQGLQRIVEDLFLLARAHAGERLLQPAELYLGELASESVRAARSLAARKHITLTYEGSTDLPMRGDEALLKRLLLNLVDNAIKYTPESGRVAVTALQNGSADLAAYSIEVRDTGPGIPAEAQSRVFERFYRTERSRRAGESASGAGLGLAIASWIAEAHGGSLVLASSDASGSVFRLTLPVRGRPSRPLVAVAADSAAGA